jgi:hypothetical protein
MASLGDATSRIQRCRLRSGDRIGRSSTRIGRFWTHMAETPGSDGEVQGADREVLRAHGAAPRRLRRSSARKTTEIPAEKSVGTAFKGLARMRIG